MSGEYLPSTVNSFSFLSDNKNVLLSCFRQVVVDQLKPDFVKMPKNPKAAEEGDLDEVAKPKENTFFLSKAITLKVIFTIDKDCRSHMNP